MAERASCLSPAICRSAICLPKRYDPSFDCTASSTDLRFALRFS
jgi:hypothetical protein